MENQKSPLLGTFTRFSCLPADEQELVSGSWEAAERAYVPCSHFPVGSTLLAQNSRGETKVFRGCNVENRFFAPTICAERNAATTAVAEGYTRFLKIALVLKNYQGPGASPCGLCRQVLTEFGKDAVVLQIADKESNVQRYHVADLLPAVSGEVVPFLALDSGTKRLVKRLNASRTLAYVPYSKQPHAAICIAANNKGGKKRFLGVSDDNSSYGGSASAECVAMRSARTAGYTSGATLFVTVDSLLAHNAVEGECLQVLREFGPDAKVVLVDAAGDAVFSSVEHMLPDSFGPEALA